MPAEAVPRPNSKLELPPGWRRARLGDVCETIAGQSPPSETYRKTPGGLPFFQGKADFGFRHPVARIWCVAPTKVALPGDILISVRAPVGPTNVADVKCCIGRGLAAIRPGDQVDRDFVLAALQLLESKIVELGSGSTFEAIKTGDLELLEVPVPPLQEQKRIAAILNEQMAALERARAGAEAQLEAAKGLPAAYLRAIFNRPEAQHWPTKRVSQLCDRIDYGFTAPANFGVAEPRFLRITDIQDGHVNWETVPGCQISLSDESTHRLADGDIVFARTGATTGKSYLIREPPRAIFASYLIRLRPTSEVIAGYMYAFFQSDGYWQQIRATARGGAQPNVNATLLGAVTLPLPPIAEQQRIVARLSELMVSAEKTREALQEQLDAVNALPAALLCRAFSGEL